MTLFPIEAYAKNKKCSGLLIQHESMHTAFDTVDRDIQYHLEWCAGIKGQGLDWFKSI